MSASSSLIYSEEAKASAIGKATSLIGFHTLVD